MTTVLVHIRYVTIFGRLEIMPQAKKCERCSEPPVEGRKLCSEHYAEYMRNYRPAANLQKEKQHRGEGFRDGVAACVRYLREQFPGTALTGLQAARNIERNVLGGESGEQKQQREFIQSLRGL